MDKKIDESIKGKICYGKKFGTLSIILMVAFFVMAALASAQVPMPHGISGTVYLSDGVTQAPAGTSFSVNDTTSGYYIEGKTGGPPGYSGYYSVSISGEDGDEVIIKAWNTTHYGIRTVNLSGDMTGINIIMNQSLLVLKSIVVSPATPSLIVGETQLFNATALDQNDNPIAGIDIYWSSSNT
ncbi:MAG: hypothetical protein IBX40_08250, partial [Methanosarcinales archaeon]|nr:hypothetical protein [Methanosarcinales archaeon]